MTARWEHRWAIYSTKKVIIVADNPQWTGPVGGPQPSRNEVQFLAISQGSGEAREGRESLQGLQEKLVSLCGAGSKPPPPQPCCAVLGCIVVEETAFLAIVLEAEVVAVVDDRRILEIRRCELLPFAACPPKGKLPSEAAAEADAAKAASVKQLLERGFYFSHDLDVTRRLQRRLSLARTPGDILDQMASAEPRYVWNRQLIEPFSVQGVTTRWWTPVMQGFIQARDCAPSPSSPSLLLIIIARRGSRRAGTRYNARGADDAGEVANWVETEQLAQIRESSRAGGNPGAGKGWLSFVQVRGSVPIFWDQPSAMSAVTITRGPDLVAVAFDRHKKWVEEEYGRVLYVNLLSESASKSESEGVLTAALNQQCKMHSGTQVIHLDFHARVSGDESTFDQELATLADRLSVQVLDNFGCLDSTTDPPAMLQRGIVRTNCFDCLDRTNILQYQLVWAWLLQYCGKHPKLQHLIRKAPVQTGSKAAGTIELGSLGDLWRSTVGEMAGQEERAPLQVVLREMWADLGDMLSEHYTGVASTMGAALRQGGNSAFTLLEKGLRSVNRAYTAKFGDEARQKVLDLLLGKHRLPRAPGAPEVRRSAAGRLAVGVVTWNLHGEPCWQASGALKALICGACAPGSGKPVDVMVFCFQEFVELTPANVMTLDTGDEERQGEFEVSALRAFPDSLGEPFLMVRSCGMVGLYVGVFVAERLRGSVKNVAADRVRAGLYGQAGNKGAVAVRFDVAETTVCVLSTHLESGHGKAAERAAQLSEVVQHSFSGPQVKTPKPVKDHDLVVLAGDFNFRLAVPEGSNTEQLESMLVRGWGAPPSGGVADPGCVGDGIAIGPAPDYQEAFSQFDELMGTRAPVASREAVRDAGLMEGPVLFPATYRLTKNARAYDQARKPAWCDRVLHTKFDVVRRRYVSLGGLLQSDHRPVAALLETSMLDMPSSASASTGTAAASEAPQKASAAQVQDLMAFNEAPSSDKPAAVVPTTMNSVDLLGSAELAFDPFDSSRLPAAASSTATPAVPVSAVAPKSLNAAPVASGYQASPQPQHPPPGLPPATGSLSVGQPVFAEFKGGWYLANVLRTRGGNCDIAWRRPNAEMWGNGEAMRQYLCSTGADETCHGTGLPIATRIRLPQGTSALPAAAEIRDMPSHGPSGPAVAPPVAPGIDDSQLLDLLG